MPTTPSYIGVDGICSECMRNNADGDRNFCEKTIRSGKCRLVAPEGLSTINDT